jgi:hypothetical protein
LFSPSFGKGRDLIDLTGTEVTEGNDGPQSLVIEGVTVKVLRNLILELFPSLSVN